MAVVTGRLFKRLKLTAVWIRIQRFLPNLNDLKKITKFV